MRDIKFRGWHTKHKKMFSAEEMARDQLTLLPTGCFINVSSTSTTFSEVYDSDKFIPLQYTGLKDKNGKEIYEGDMLKDDTGMGRVLFCAPAFVVIDYSGLVWSLGGGIVNIKDNLLNTEVIGNIYESPELLEIE